MDPTKVKGDMSSQAGMTKALQFMNMPSSDGKSNNKSKNKAKAKGAKEGTGDKDQVKAETPQDTAKNLITKVLKDANTCRQGVSKKSLISSMEWKAKKGLLAMLLLSFFCHFKPIKQYPKRMSNHVKSQKHFGFILFPSYRPRDMAFRLKPLEMSDQLIQQLKAIQNQFEKQARVLQELVNQGKQKMKHYAAAMEEAPRNMENVFEQFSPVIKPLG